MQKLILFRRSEIIVMKNYICSGTELYKYEIFYVHPVGTSENWPLPKSEEASGEQLDQLKQVNHVCSWAAVPM